MPPNIDKENASDWINKLSDSGENINNEFLQVLETMNEKEISQVIALTHGADFKNVSAAAAKQKIKKWISTTTQNKATWPYSQMLKPVLKHVAREKGMPHFVRNQKKDIIINTIVEFDQNQQSDEPNWDNLAPLAQFLD